jgi:phosphocarrier protein
MQQRTVIISNRLGLHARAAAKLVRLAGSYTSKVTLTRCDRREQSADARSILAVLMLAASQHTQIELTINGVDEQLAMEALCQLIDDKFGEN